MRKRGTPAGEPVTFLERVALKRSADNNSEDLGIYDSTKKRHTSFDDILGGEPIEFLSDKPTLGEGAYGQAKLLCDEDGDGVAVAKISGCGTISLGDPLLSPFRAEHVEPRILQFLWQHIVETRRSPHLLAPMGTHSIVRGGAAAHLVADAEQTQSLVFFMEHATAFDMRTYLSEMQTNRVDFDLHLRVLLFQIIYTLGAIYKLFPSFRHNDLKDDNVLLHKSVSQGYTKYTIYGRDYCLPAIGVTAMIADFDFSCIVGYMFDNYKVLEQKWETPTYAMSTEENHCADIFSLVTFLRRQFDGSMSRELRQSIQTLFGPFRSGNFNRLHPSKHDAPSVEFLIQESGLFDDFICKVPNGIFLERFNADAPVVNIVFPVQWAPCLHVRDAKLPMRERAFCPVFRRRHPTEMKALPSLQYYELCKQSRRVAEESTVYDKAQCDAIVGHLVVPYTSKRFRDKDGDFMPYYNFSTARQSEFLERTGTMAARFIQDYHVPYRWWFAAHTCAFLDVAYEMDLFEMGHKCWYLWMWVQHWENLGYVSYTEMHLLHFIMQWGWLKIQ